MALAQMPAPKGRGARYHLDVGGPGATLIDESYNANPASMRAAIALLGQAKPGKLGRRIAVLGDMRELGATSSDLHAALLEPLNEAEVDRIFLAGPLMSALWDVIPNDRRGAWCDSAEELIPVVEQAIGRGDIVMVKGSNASRMGSLVEALKKRFVNEEDAEERQGEEAI
jgi:UDP-N-acetylmuramoyl-tripeptide--D-alanyl-D-alanine ligase